MVHVLLTSAIIGTLMTVHEYTWSDAEHVVVIAVMSDGCGLPIAWDAFLWELACSN